MGAQQSTEAEDARLAGVTNASEAAKITAVVESRDILAQAGTPANPDAWQAGFVQQVTGVFQRLESENAEKSSQLSYERERKLLYKKRCRELERRIQELQD